MMHAKLQSKEVKQTRSSIAKTGGKHEQPWTKAKLMMRCNCANGTKIYVADKLQLLTTMP